MPVEPGQTLLHYRLIDKIGEGGMGVVWRATDTTLDREVAIKLLPAQFAGHPERLARFEREAKILASLNHPNIAAIYGLHIASEIRFLAMELVPGEDLAQRIARGPLAIDQAVDFADQVAQAVETANEQGVVHRDLKPANVRITPEGKVKVLDFGLAKAIDPTADSQPADAALSPTLTRATAVGVVLGTAAYMSPEQARGETVDQRVDVWAFGCLLYEMLTGRPPFAGRSITDILAALVRDEPAWDALPANTPAAVRRLLRRCLVKDPRRRLRNVGDAGLELQEIGEHEGYIDPEPERTAVGHGKTTARGWLSFAWAALLVAIAIIVFMITSRDAVIPADATHVDLRLTGLEAATNRWGTPPIALAPDGRSVAYVVHQPDGSTRIALRSLDSHERRLLPGTEDAVGPFFSPDGEWVGFFTASELRKVRITGGSTAQTLHRFPGRVSALGASWAADQSIVFAVERLGLLELPAAGGEPVVLSRPDPANGELHHGFPFVLPGGRDVLFTVSSGVTQSAVQLAVLARDTGDWRLIQPDGQSGSQAHYLSGGSLAYVDGDRLMVAPFDLSRHEMTRAPVSVVTDLHLDLGSGVAYFAMASPGTLLYLPVVSNRVVWVNRHGVATSLLEQAGNYIHPRLSPDGSKISLLSRRGGDTDVWIIDVDRSSIERLTFGGKHGAPLWTADGRGVTLRLRFPLGIATQPVDGTGDPRTVLSDGNENMPMSWSSDGRKLAYERRMEGGTIDIWACETENCESPSLLIGSSFNDESPRFSPDGRWLAWVSDGSGQREVYVAPFPALDRRQQVSSGGGSEPVWSHAGGELIFRQGRAVLSVSLTERDGVLKPGTPQKLFEGNYNLSRVGHAHYDISVDGERFVMIEESPAAFESLRMILGWDRELDSIFAAD